MEFPAPRDRRPQRIAVLPGDGIGRDVVREAIKVLETAAERWSLPLELRRLPWSADHYLETGETLPHGALEELAERYAAILVGAYGDPRVPDMRHAADILLGIRFGLDLYINFRPIKLYDARLCPLKDRDVAAVDFVVFRENTEGAYVGAGGIFKKGTEDEVAVQEEIHTRKGVDRILRAAFEYARAHGRERVCMADKSNARRFSGDLWQCASPRWRPTSPRWRRSTSTSTPWRCSWCGPPTVSRWWSPTTCSETSSPTSAPRSREGSGWRPRPTSIRGGPRCSSRCTDRPPSTPAPTARTRWRRSSPRR